MFIPLVFPVAEQALEFSHTFDGFGTLRIRRVTFEQRRVAMKALVDVLALKIRKERAS